MLVFHGYPGGRQLDQSRGSKETGAWLFVLERPGFGLSDRCHERTVLSWADDVADAADELGFDQFSVLGFSGGALYALACGYALAERVRRIGVVSGFVPLVDEADLDGLLEDDFRESLQKYRSDPAAIVAEIDLANRRQCLSWAEDPDEFARTWFGPKAERMDRFWISVLASTFGGQPDGTDERLWYQPSGIRCDEVAAPVYLWYGDQDDNLKMGEEVETRVPSCALTVYPGEGHLLDPNHAVEWLTLLTAGEP